MDAAFHPCPSVRGLTGPLRQEPVQVTVDWQAREARNLRWITLNYLWWLNLETRLVHRRSAALTSGTAGCSVTLGSFTHTK
jgi:hypothetical protein